MSSQISPLNITEARDVTYAMNNEIEGPTATLTQECVDEEKPKSVLKQIYNKISIFHYKNWSHLFKYLIFYTMVIYIINLILMYSLDDQYSGIVKSTVSPDGTAINTPRTISEIFLQPLYFTTTTVSTIGYGDICPTSTLTRTITAFQQLMLIFVLYNTLQNDQSKNLESIKKLVIDNSYLTDEQMSEKIKELKIVSKLLFKDKMQYKCKNIGVITRPMIEKILKDKASIAKTNILEKKNEISE